ncbi:MAG: hypothetical protein EAZ07_03310 [Cytophagales bacterium]|nr:MAG: hypothetical protein EAZ07_03310 [Cytophagales bacterium]
MISDCVWAQSNYQLLPSPINIQGSDEFFPSLSANGRVMLYQAPLGDLGESKYAISYQKNGVWSSPAIIPQINSEVKNLNSNGHFLSYDANQIFFSSAKYGGIGGMDIWMCYKNGSSWTNPVNIASPINSIANEVDPCMSADGRYLFFTRLIPGQKTKTGAPCGKIYFSKKVSKSSWAQPQLLSQPINTGCECNLRILPDQQTITFASERKGGKGGYDQYLSSWNDDGTWTNPKAIDQVCTANDDLYISIPAGGDYVYYTAEIKKSKDIVRSLLTQEQKPYKTLIINSKFINSPANAEFKPSVVIYENSLSYLIYPNQSNNYFIALNQNDKVEVVYQADYKKYLPQIERYQLDTLTKYYELNTQINLTSIKKDAIYYFSKYPKIANYAEELKNELSVLARLMKENIDFRFQIEYFSPSIDTLISKITDQEINILNEKINIAKEDANILKKFFVEKYFIPETQILIQPTEKIYVKTPKCSFYQKNTEEQVLYLKVL